MVSGNQFSCTYQKDGAANTIILHGSSIQQTEQELIMPLNKGQGSASSTGHLTSSGPYKFSRRPTEKLLIDMEGLSYNSSLKSLSPFILEKKKQETMRDLHII